MAYVVEGDQFPRKTLWLVMFAIAVVFAAVCAATGATTRVAIEFDTALPWGLAFTGNAGKRTCETPGRIHCEIESDGYCIWLGPGAPPGRTPPWIGMNGGK